MHGKLLNGLLVEKTLEGLTEKFLALIRLQSVGFSSLFENLFEAMLPVLIFSSCTHAYHASITICRCRSPYVDVDHHKQIAVTAIVIGQALHLHQISDPLVIQTAQDHRKPSTSRTVQRVGQITFYCPMWNGPKQSAVRLPNCLRWKGHGRGREAFLRFDTMRRLEMTLQPQDRNHQHSTKASSSLSLDSTWCEMS